MGDMSEGKLSRETGVPQTTIHRILTGEIRESKPSTVQPLADYFGVTIAEMSSDYMSDKTKPKKISLSASISFLRKMEKRALEQLEIIRGEIDRLEN